MLFGDGLLQSYEYLKSLKMISLLAKRSGFDESQLGIWFNPFELNQPIIPLLTFFFILIACLLDIVLIM